MDTGNLEAETCHLCVRALNLYLLLLLTALLYFKFCRDNIIAFITLEIVMIIITSTNNDVKSLGYLPFFIISC